MSLVEFQQLSIENAFVDGISLKYFCEENLFNASNILKKTKQDVCDHSLSRGKPKYRDEKVEVRN